MKSGKKMSPEKLEEQLQKVISCLDIPKYCSQIFLETNISTLQKKLKGWAEKELLYATKVSINSRNYIYYSVKIFDISEIPNNPTLGKIKNASGAPSEKWFTTNGNSTIYRPSLNKKYTEQMKLHKKAAQRNYVSGSSLDTF